MSMPQFPQVDREQALNNMIQALALQEAAIASLIYAEAAKVDALVQHGVPPAESLQQVESFQASITGILQYVAQKSEAINRKLEALKNLTEFKQMPNQPE